MDSETLIASIALVISLTSAIWSFWYNLHIKNSNKVNKTTEMSILFNNVDFHNSRGIGWVLLEAVNSNTEVPVTFKNLWEDINNIEKTTKFSHLYRVLSFWQMLYTLGEQDEIDKKLANRLFKYEFQWWYRQVSTLIKNTNNSKEEIPGCFEVFKKNPQWLREN